MVLENSTPSVQTIFIYCFQLLLSEVTGKYDTYIPPVLRFCDAWSSGSAQQTPDGLLLMPKVKNKMIFVGECLEGVL